MITLISSPNSMRLCLQISQGATGSSFSATYRQGLKLPLPLHAAFAIAALSARMAAPEEAISDLAAV
jgi:hypothetical protein